MDSILWAAVDGGFTRTIKINLKARSQHDEARIGNGCPVSSEGIFLAAALAPLERQMLCDFCPHRMTIMNSGSNQRLLALSPDPKGKSG